MKKRKTKLLAREAQRSVYNEIKSKLIDHLSELTGSIEHGSKKLRKVIEKESKKLAKKLVKKIDIQTPSQGSEVLPKEPAVAASRSVQDDVKSDTGSLLNPTNTKKSGRVTRKKPAQKEGILV